MSDFSATLDWSRQTPDFAYDTYDRNHHLLFGSGTKIECSAAPDYKGDETKVNPEEALLGAIMSCHMLTFLAVAAKKRLKVDSYKDHGTAVLEKNAKGMFFVSEARINPVIVFSGDQPTADQLKIMHEKAHQNCFIANTVLTKIFIHGV